MIVPAGVCESQPHFADIVIKLGKKSRVTRRCARKRVLLHTFTVKSDSQRVAVQSVRVVSVRSETPLSAHACGPCRRLGVGWFLAGCTCVCTLCIHTRVHHGYIHVFITVDFVHLQPTSALGFGAVNFCAFATLPILFGPVMSVTNVPTSVRVAVVEVYVRARSALNDPPNHSPLYVLLP